MDSVYNIDLIPEGDAERVAALERYQIINSHREKAFDSICEMACELFSCPISHISFLNADTEFIKAGVGIGDITHVSRGSGFCALAILKPELMLIEDASKHELLANHPFVVGGLKIRFYAAAPVITSDGHIIGTLCIIDTKPRTISKKKQMLLQRLAQVVMEQTELRLNNLHLLQQKDEFINIAAHEMRTPLTTLKAAMQMLDLRLADKDDQATARLVGQASRGVGKLARLVNDLVEAGGLNEPGLNFERGAFPVGRLLESCREYAATFGNFRLEVTGPENLQVVGDLSKIEQVLINLVDNAIRYAPKSKVINIHFEEIPGFVRVSVTDKGNGISADDLPKLFRRYFRAESKDFNTGLGLGLYIAAEIVKNHGGEIGVESTPGEGATFWFTLPMR